MRDALPSNPPAPGWQQRRGGTRFFFCCCPLTLALAPFLLVGHLVRYGVLSLLGRDPVSPWAGRHGVVV